MAIATKEPEQMDAEELAAYEQWNKWKELSVAETRRQREQLEERQRRIEEVRREGAERTAQYMSSLRDIDRREKETSGTLEWFLSKVRAERRPLEVIRLDRSDDEAAAFLAAAYEQEVVRRSTTMQRDMFTDAAIKAVARWTTKHTKPGLMLRGYVGVGKTTMMWAMRSVFRHLMDETMEIIDARSVADTGKSDGNELARLAGERLLGIDDLGTEPLTVKNYGNESSPLVELLARRYENRRFTVITTNLANDGDTDELLTIYGERTYDRIKEMFNIVSYDGDMKSYRK